MVPPAGDARSELEADNRNLHARRAALHASKAADQETAKANALAPLQRLVDTAKAREAEIDAKIKHREASNRSARGVAAPQGADDHPPATDRRRHAAKRTSTPGRRAACEGTPAAPEPGMPTSTSRSQRSEGVMGARQRPCSRLSRGSGRRLLAALLVAPLVDLHVDPRDPAAQPSVLLPGGYRAPAGVADVRLLSAHRLAAVVLDEPLERIRDEPSAVVLMQVAVGFGAHPSPRYGNRRYPCRGAGYWRAIDRPRITEPPRGSRKGAR